MFTEASVRYNQILFKIPVIPREVLPNSSYPQWSVTSHMGRVSKIRCRAIPRSFPSLWTCYESIIVPRSLINLMNSARYSLPCQQWNKSEVYFYHQITIVNARPSRCAIRETMARISWLKNVNWAASVANSFNHFIVFVLKVMSNGLYFNDYFEFDPGRGPTL